MPIITPPPDGSGPRVITIEPPHVPRLAVIALGLVVLFGLGFSYWWFVQRIEVEAGEVLVLIRRMGADLVADKDGRPLPPELRNQVVLYPELVAALPGPAERFKGIQYEVLPEGRYFRDPFLWQRLIVPAVIINQDEVGIRIRKYGRPLADGKIVATEPDERGPLADVLLPDRYNINPFAYDVVRVKQVEIRAGYVGVQTLLHGAPPTDPNVWVVQEGEQGVQPSVLPPGRYYNNPFVRRIDEVDVRSHTLDLRGEGAIRFPSKDSFEIGLEATVEYAIRQDRAPYVLVAVGDRNDIEEKLILPYARSLARIEGSKLLAREFISGDTREAFQQSVFEGLRAQCSAQGIEIRATPIRRIEPPAAIADPISDRQIAEQQIKRYESEIEVARAQADLVEQEELQKQNQAIGVANRDVVAVVKQAEQAMAVALTEANKRLEVIRLQLKAAEEDAAALRARGQAEAEIITLGYRAETEPLRAVVNAFGDGETYAQFFFYQKLGPALKSILASTDGPLADILGALSTGRGGAPLPSARAPRAAGAATTPATIGGPQ
jgi:hypothetical protein